MSVSTGALIVGALGLIYGLSATRWSGERGQRFAVIGAFGLLAAILRST